MAQRKISFYRPEPTESGLFASRVYQDFNWNGISLHSIYLDVLAERGLLGVGLFGALLWIAFRSLARVRRGAEGQPAASQAVALGGALVGVLTCGAFLSVAYYPYLWHLTALCGALSAGSDEPRRSRARS